MRIGIFGGSFDPIHLGHLVVAGSAADQLALDLVRFVPTRIQPFKANGHGASPEDRQEMVRLGIEGDTRFVLDARELRRSGPSYTVDTLRQLRAECPGDGLLLLIGADAARDLPEWRDAAAVAGLAEIVVLTRPGVAPQAHELVARTIRVPAVNISATEIREKVRRGESIRRMVPPRVADYIESHRLYRYND